MVGDVILPRLGLSQSKWEELSLSLDTIIHAGALVNHAFSYEQLYQPNILGTGTYEHYHAQCVGNVVYEPIIV